MENHEITTAAAGFLEKLRESGLRVTPQRETLFKIFAESLDQPTTVQDLWTKTREFDPSIGIATVYRTINLLGEMGLLNVLYLNEGEFRLEMPKEKLSLTAFCRHCGSLFPLSGGEEKKALLEEWLAESGLELLPQSLSIAGLCGGCRELLQKEDAPPARGGPFGRLGQCRGRRCRKGRGGGSSADTSS